MSNPFVYDGEYLESAGLIVSRPSILPHAPPIETTPATSPDDIAISIESWHSQFDRLRLWAAGSDSMTDAHRVWWQSFLRYGVYLQRATAADPLAQKNLELLRLAWELLRCVHDGPEHAIRHAFQVAEQRIKETARSVVDLPTPAKAKGKASKTTRKKKKSKNADVVQFWMENQTLTSMEALALWKRSHPECDMSDEALRKAMSRHRKNSP